VGTSGGAEGLAPLLAHRLSVEDAVKKKRLGIEGGSYDPPLPLPFVPVNPCPRPNIALLPSPIGTALSVSDTQVSQRQTTQLQKSVTPKPHVCLRYDRISVDGAPATGRPF